MSCDARLIGNGRVIPSEGYADQPYVVITRDHAWLCVITTGAGDEGNAGQHIVARRSIDQGRTWSDPVSIEPADGPEASYAVLLMCPSGRIYCFYNHNTDRVPSLRTEDGGTFTRVDSLGHYVFKYSDDDGRTWSEKRYDVPVREFACDRNNVYGGALRFFWNVGRPCVDGQRVYMTLHKVGAMGVGFFAASEGVVLASDNLLTETDPEKIQFQTLPDGDIGLKTPPGGGRVSEEQSLTVLSDGSLYCVYRSIDGWPVCSYSRDRGHTWSVPEYKTFSPGGRRVKHPRAANFIWRCHNGKYLYWFHNHGGAAVKRSKDWDPYADRNPVWMMAGREIATPNGVMLEWSQPEIVLYDDDPRVRISYPDLIEDRGKYFVTETQKSIGRVHELDTTLVEGLFHQWDNHLVTQHHLLLELHDARGLHGLHAMPRLPDFNEPDNRLIDRPARDMRTGFTMDLWFVAHDLSTQQTLMDTRSDDGRGMHLALTPSGSILFTMDDERQCCMAEFESGRIVAGQLHHVAVVVDGGPKVITCIINGVLCDGGDERQFGWFRFSPTLRSANGLPSVQLAPDFAGMLYSLRLYGRALRTSELIGHWQSGVPRVASMAT